MHSPRRKTGSITEDEEEGEDTFTFIRREMTRDWFRDEVNNSLNLVIIPLLILSGLAVGFVLVWASDILVPFVISVFFTYLLRPIVDFLSRPLFCVLPFRFAPRTFSQSPPPPPPLPSSLQHQAIESQPNENVNLDVEHASLLSSNASAPKPRKTVPRSTTPPGVGNSGITNFALSRGTTHTSLQVPRWMAILMSMLFVMALFVGLFVLVADAMQSFEQNSLAAYEERLMELLNMSSKWLKRTFNVDGTHVMQQIKNEFQVLEITKSLVLILINAVGYTFVVMLFVLYMLFEGQTQPEPVAKQPSVRRQIDDQIQRYLVTKTLISAVVGLLTYLVLGPLLQVQMAHLFGVVTFLMNFIPNVGAVVATLLPLPIVVLDENLTTISVLLAFLLPIAIHTVVGNIVEPIFFGQQMELHPIVVLLSLSFWFSIWGVPGAILSVPITAVMRIVVCNINHPYAQFAKNLMEGKMELPNSSSYSKSGSQKGRRTGSAMKVPEQHDLI
ncbi:hypothetical protein BASA81_006483 [Batrachochytrium salamandrivorans]|nr:hypothetical protein BASA81_006483 [Batrachochytrium salamandrivorans]